MNATKLKELIRASGIEMYHYYSGIHHTQQADSEVAQNIGYAFSR